MNIEIMTGLEIMEAILREELPHHIMTESIPVKVMKVEKGKVVSMLSQIISTLTLNFVTMENCFHMKKHLGSS